MATIVEVDKRRRTSLSKLGRKEHTRYLAETYDDGTIILSPAVVMTEREAAVLANPALIERLRAGVAEAKAGQTRPISGDLLARLEATDD